ALRVETALRRLYPSAQNLGPSRPRDAQNGRQFSVPSKLCPCPRGLSEIRECTRRRSAPRGPPYPAASARLRENPSRKAPCVLAITIPAAPLELGPPSACG